MRWSDCTSGGVVNVVPSCQFNSGERRMVLSMVPGADVGAVVGWTLVVDLASDAATLPDWWQVQPSGCRAGQIVAGTPTGTEGGCVDAWSSAGASVVQSILYPRPGGDARQLRLILGVGVPAGDAFALTAGETYLAGILAIHFARTVPPGECAGCTEPVCIVFNSAEIVRSPGAPGESPQPYVTASPEFGNQITWGDGTACAAVPTRNRTWGQVKALYR